MAITGAINNKFRQNSCIFPKVPNFNAKLVLLTVSLRVPLPAVNI